MKMIYSMDRKYYKKNVSFNTVLDPQNELRTIYEFLDKDRLISKNLSRISVLNDNYTDKQCEFSGEFVEEQEYEYFTINEQISNFAQTYPTNLKASSNEALLFMRRYRFANCSCFSCCFKDAYPSSNVQ